MIPSSHCISHLCINVNQSLQQDKYQLFFEKGTSTLLDIMDKEKIFTLNLQEQAVHIFSNLILPTHSQEQLEFAISFSLCETIFSQHKAPSQLNDLNCLSIYRSLIPHIQIEKQDLYHKEFKEMLITSNEKYDKTTAHDIQLLLGDQLLSQNDISLIKDLLHAMWIHSEFLQYFPYEIRGKAVINVLANLNCTDIDLSKIKEMIDNEKNEQVIKCTTLIQDTIDCHEDQILINENDEQKTPLLTFEETIQNDNNFLEDFEKINQSQNFQTPQNKIDSKQQIRYSFYLCETNDSSDKSTNEYQDKELLYELEISDFLNSKIFKNLNPPSSSLPPLQS